MFHLFEVYIKKMIPGITAENIQQLQDACVLKKLRRRETILQEGEVCYYKMFVTKGLLRNYRIGDNGAEHIVRFADAGSWTTDPESYYNGLPSVYNIDALESSELVIFTHDKFEALKKQIPSLAEFSEMVITKSAIINQKRVMMNISATPEEMYLDFVNNFPDIFHRVPLHMVASYLGISRETLTRIRQGLAVAK